MAQIILSKLGRIPAHLILRMEKTLALHSLTEAAELLRMIEEIAALSPDRAMSLLPGMRITMRLARERILMGQQVFSSAVPQEKPHTIHQMVELTRESTEPSSEAQAYIQSRKLNQPPTRP